MLSKIRVPLYWLFCINCTNAIGSYDLPKDKDEETTSAHYTVPSYLDEYRSNECLLDNFGEVGKKRESHVIAYGEDIELKKVVSNNSTNDKGCKKEFHHIPVMNGMRNREVNIKRYELGKWDKFKKALVRLIVSPVE